MKNGIWFVVLVCIAVGVFWFDIHKAQAPAPVEVPLDGISST